MTPGGDSVVAPTRMPGPLARGLARLYRAEIGRRNARYDRGLGVTRLDRPVVSVGNLSAGGTGKTPVVRWVVGVLQDAGFRPVVAMRGYGAARGEASDEEIEHRAALPGVAVVARPDRIAGLRAHFDSPEGAAADCVVLDDGFQHRRLARDLDIVLVDASRPPDRDALLPAGYLREPIGSLGRADAVIVTHAELVSADGLDRVTQSVRGQMRDGVPLAIAEHRWVRLRVERSEDGAAPTEAPVGWLQDRRVFAVCAIGNPRGFFNAAERSGARLVGQMALPDHDAYHERTVADIVHAVEDSRAEAVLLTAKDWAKLVDRRVRWPCSTVIPELGIAFINGEKSLAQRVIGAISR